MAALAWEPLWRRQDERQSDRGQSESSVGGGGEMSDGCWSGRQRTLIECLLGTRHSSRARDSGVRKSACLSVILIL